MCRYPFRYIYIPLLQHEPEVRAPLFVTKYRHAPDSMMTTGPAPRVSKGKILLKHHGNCFSHSVLTTAGHHMRI
jgi:hypothetical protein